MAPTITSIARKAGVSKGLVSRLLRGDTSLRISEQRRKQILAVRDSLIKEGGASSNGSRRRLTYNFVIPCFGESIFLELQAHLETDMFQGLRQTLRDNGFQLSITTYDEDDVLEGITELMTSRYCDGLMLLGEAVNEDIAKMILDKEFPHVSSDSSAADIGLNTVCEDAGTGIFQAVKHLKKLGHERIGFLGRQWHHYSLFLAAIARAGLPIDESFNCISPIDGARVPMHVEGWRYAAKLAFGDWLDKKNNATAMICHNDYGALGAIDAMESRELVAGKDISLVGFDNIERDSDNPVLTTIEMDGRSIGVRIAQLLMNQVLHDQKQILHEYMPVKFIQRKSTGQYSN